ncbi:MAG: hypothetical protein KDK70_42900, partial [Myxococcales bacterium]|nr:hypothetical protein [Myxococcales bacterium]
GSRALTRAMVSGRVRPPPVSLMCRMHPARCVQGDGLGISREPLPPVDPAATVPPWDLRAMHRSARRYASAPPHAGTALLGWSIVEDDRPLRNHNAVVLVEHRKGKRYSVVTLYRHAVNEAWNIDNSLHSSNRPVVAFDHRPTAAEVEQVLTRNGWQLEGEPEGFAVLAGTMPAATWVEWLGAAPSVTIRVTAVAPDR